MPSALPSHQHLQAWPFLGRITAILLYTLVAWPKRAALLFELLKRDQDNLDPYRSSTIWVANEIKAGPENDATRLAIEAGMFRLVETQEPTHLQFWTVFPNIEKSSIILKDIPHYT